MLHDSKFKIQNSTLRTPNSALRTLCPAFRIRQSAFRNQKGFTYLALLAVLVIIGISLGAAGKYWQGVVLRDKEEELLVRGDQYRQAIERYYLAPLPVHQYPKSIDDLLSDSRFPTAKRHLRQRYKDPFTGENFVEIREPGGIIGVRSESEKTPLKQSNFPAPFQDFAGKSRYSDWEFLAIIKPGLQTVPSAPPVPGVPPPALPRP